MSRIGSEPSTASAGAPSGTRNAPRSPGSARRSCNSAPNSSANAALYSSTSPANRPPNGISANPEYASAETSTAFRGVPRSSVTASAGGKRPSCASTSGMREYASNSALNSANALTSPAPAIQTPSHGPTTTPASQRHRREHAERREHQRDKPSGRRSHDPGAPQVEPGGSPDHRERHDPGLEAAEPRQEEPQVLQEQHRIDRHVDQRVDPGEPAVPETPEAPERALHPLVIASLDGEHRRQLPDEQRLGHTIDEGGGDEQQHRHPGAHRADQSLEAERAARDGEEHHRHEGPEAQRRSRGP